MTTPSTAAIVNADADAADRALCLLADPGVWSQPT